MPDIQILIFLWMALSRYKADYDRHAIIKRLIEEDDYDFRKMVEFANLIHKFPDRVDFLINWTHICLVHAGEIVEFTSSEKIINIYLYSKGMDCFIHAIEGTVIIAGHASTSDEGEFVFNNGKKKKQLIKQYREEVIDALDRIEELKNLIETLRDQID